MDKPKKVFEINKDFDIDKFQSVARVPQKLKKKPKMDNFALAKYSDIGYYLVTPLLAGLFLGLYVSHVTKIGIFVLGGIALGAGVTFYNLFRLTKKL